MLEPSEHRPTQAIIDLNAIQDNLKLVNNTLDEGQIIYVAVKANAYGHGAIHVAKAAIEAGAKGLLVATVDEAISLRRAGLSQIPILVLGLTDPRGIAEILHYNITITVSDLSFFARAYDQLQATEQVALLDLYQLNFHLALDTGMGRIGLRHQEEVADFAKGIKDYSWARWEGVFTHFSTAGGGPKEYVSLQHERWLDLLEAVPSNVTYRHFANSAMGFWYPLEPKTDIVRLGIGLYGIDPLDRPQEELTGLEGNLKPAFSLVSELVYVKEVEAGEAISYGATYRTEQKQWIGTVPIGYADGWFRHYDKIEVLVEGYACPVVGKINMDQMMIALPHELPVGSMVTLIGQSGKAENRASDLARKVGTISYEIFCGISERVPRVYLKE